MGKEGRREGGKEKEETMKRERNKQTKQDRHHLAVKPEIHNSDGQPQYPQW